MKNGIFNFNNVRTNMKHMRALLVVAVGMFSLNASAFDLYVSTNGNDNSSGTQLAPLKTIARASALAKAGTTIHVAPGTYTGNFVTRANGTATAPIKYLSDVKWGAKLVGTGTGVLWFDYGSYVEVDGFDMSTTGRIGFVSTGSNGKIRNNYVHDVIVSGGISGAGGAGLDVAGPGWVIHNNIVRNIDAALKTDHRVQGIYLASANNLVYNNVIENVVGQGVNSWHGANRNVVVNNTVINTKFGILMGSGDSGQLPNGSQYNYVANNILLNNRSGGIQEGGKTSYNTYVNNLFFGNPVNYGPLNSTSKATGTVVGDPKLVNRSARDYHLQSSSAAINKGTSDRAPASDYDGKSRVGAVDIGAFEYVGTSITPSPTATPQPSPSPRPSPSPSPSPLSTVSLSTNSLVFGTQAVGTTSAAQIVTIKNVGTTAFTIPSVFVITGDFGFGNLGTCSTSASYAPGASCTASVVFKPTATGLRTGSLSIKTSASATALVVSLKGNYTATSPTPTATPQPSPSPRPSPSPSPTATPRPSPTPVALYHLYVSPIGSDSNSGSQSSPLKTITRASVLAKPGTLVHVAPGTYTGGFQTAASGTATARISYVSDTKWGAKIVGSGSGYIWVNTGNYVTVDGFDLSGAGKTHGLVSGPWNGVEAGHHFTATNNYVHDMAVGVCGSGGAITGSSKTGHSIITNNVIRNIGVSLMGKCATQQGIYISDPDSYIANNLVSGVAAIGIHQWHGATRSTVVNNTVFNCTWGVLIGSGDSGQLPDGSQDNYIANNIVANNLTHGFHEYGKTSRNTYRNNLLFNNPANIWNASGNVITGTITADPKFVNYQANGTGNYRLQSTSPAINKGLATSAPTTDLDGKPRPQGGAYDIGAYESF